MVAFLSWYSIPPVMHYIAEDLKIPTSQVHNSNVVAVASTISLLDISFSELNTYQIWQFHVWSLVPSASVSVPVA